MKLLRHLFVLLSLLVLACSSYAAVTGDDLQTAAHNIHTRLGLHSGTTIGLGMMSLTPHHAPFLVVATNSLNSPTPQIMQMATDYARTLGVQHIMELHCGRGTKVHRDGTERGYHAETWIQSYADRSGMTLHSMAADKAPCPDCHNNYIQGVLNPLTRSTSPPSGRPQPDWKDDVDCDMQGSHSFMIFLPNRCDCIICTTLAVKPNSLRRHESVRLK